MDDQIKRRRKIERAALHRLKKEKLKTKLKKDYVLFIEENGGWPTAKNQQVIQRIIK